MRGPSSALSLSRRSRLLGVVMLAVALIAGPLSPVAAYADESDDSARWDFSGGAASDVSWHGHDGTAAAGVSFGAAGAIFNGTDGGEITVDYASSYQPEAAGDKGTWQLKLDDVTPAVVSTNHRTIMGTRGADDGWALYLTPQKRIEFWMGQKSGSTKYLAVSSGIVAAVGATYDITVERTGNDVSIAVSGAATGTGKGVLGGGYSAVKDGTKLRFGNGGNSGTEFFYSGSIRGATIRIVPPTGEPPIIDPKPPITVPTPEFPLPDEEYEAAAEAVLARSIGDVADQVDFDLERSTAGVEEYTISGSPGDIAIQATTPSALTAAAGWYLKYVAHAAVNLGSTRPVVPDLLPAPESPIANTGHEGYRFAMNDTNEGYTDPYLDWDGWERLLDNLALHGVNQVFLSIGTDAVFAKLLQEYGYSDAEARAWIPQPAHQPWWVLQNISSEGQEPMTTALLDERARLASLVVERANALGITPVLPGFFGTVPTDFAQRNPGANVVAQGTWSNYQRPSWLDPTSAVFADVAADYYRISSELVGDAGAYKMDPLHEGGKPGNVSVPGAASGIEKALHAAHPKALWVLLGWQSNPGSALLSGITDKSRLLIVDGLSDTVGTLDREARWPGIPYAFGSIYNFGGNTSIGAISTVWIDRYFAARAKAGSALTGVAILPEGFYNNPAAYELLSELPWLDGAPDHTDWFQEYALGRYGSDAAAAAWKTIAETAYSMKPIGTHSESHDGLFAAQPSLTTTKARSCCAVGEVRYDLAKFATALPQLLEADDDIVQRAAYEYDLTDVTRQVIANLSRDLLPQLNTAFQGRDIDEFDALTKSWMDLIAQLDAVLATDSEFLLGAYVDRAQAQNGAIGAYDLQNLLTTWGTKKSFSLHDYANREWQGLVGDFYASRWEQYFQTLRTSLVQGGSPAAIDWFDVDETWARGDHGYPSEPSGDILVEAQKTVDALAKARVSLSLSAPTIRPGATGTVTAQVQNTSPLATIDRVVLTLDPPTGVVVSGSAERTLAGIAPGETRTTQWDVAVDPLTAQRAVADLGVDARVIAGDSEQTKSATTTVLIGASPSEPWLTHSTEIGTDFSANGGQFAINTTGADFSRTTRRFAAVFRDDAFKGGQTAEAHVDVQQSEGARPWARAGIVASADITTGTSAMVLLAVTPANGCVLTWNGTSSGSLDTHRYAPGFSGTVWLRLIRTDRGFEGACSTDREAWTVLGVATPVGLTGPADTGMLASAVNSGGKDRLLAAFSAWSLEDPPTVPNAPDTPTAVGVDDSSIAVTWSAPDDDGRSPVTGYRVYEAGASEPVCEVGGAVTTCTVSGLELGTSHQYAVAAVNGIGEGTRSAVSATVTLPEVPSNDGAMGPPAAGVLSSDNGWDTGLRDGAFRITWNKWRGENASLFELYENGALVSKKYLTAPSTGAQTTNVDISGLSNGTYQYVAVLKNSKGRTQTAAIVVSVTDANPGKPVLSSENKDRDGEYTVYANLWWGTNATSYRFLENGVEISSGTLTAMTPKAQRASVHVTDGALGSHVYTVQFRNRSGETTSAPITVVVSR